MATTSVQQSIKLPSGALMPIIGFGTWKVNTDVEDIILKALKTGYRHIDTAYVYRNETEIGRALTKAFQDGLVKREDLFIVTKLPSHAHRRAQVIPTLKGCLERLNLSYVDLFLVHTPLSELDRKEPSRGNEPYQPDRQANYVDAWLGMEDAVKAGLTKSIGLSNFNKKQITRILENCTIKPENLQVECHAYLQQRDLLHFCQANNISFTAYSPIGRPGLLNLDGENEPVLMEDEEVKKVAAKHGKTPVQVLLHFLVQLGMAVIPKSANEGRMKENLQVFDFTLDESDMTVMKSLDRGIRYVRFDKIPGMTDHPEYPFKEPF